MPVPHHAANPPISSGLPLGPGLWPELGSPLTGLLQRDLGGVASLLTEILTKTSADPREQKTFEYARLLLTNLLVSKLEGARELIFGDRKEALLDSARGQDDAARKSYNVPRVAGSTQGVGDSLTYGAFRQLEISGRKWLDMKRSADKKRSESRSEYVETFRNSKRPGELPLTILVVHYLLDLALAKLPSSDATACRKLLAETQLKITKGEITFHSLDPRKVRDSGTGLSVLRKLAGLDSPSPSWVPETGQSICTLGRSFVSESGNKFLLHRRVSFVEPITQDELKKLQASVKIHDCSAAVLEVCGPISPKLVEWSEPRSAYDFGPIPNVAIVLPLLLPSGRVYRIMVKNSIPPAPNLELNEGDPSSEDAKVIAAVKSYFYEAELRRAPQVFGKVQVGGLSSKIAGFLTNPLEAPNAFEIARAIGGWHRGVGFKLIESLKRTHPQPYNIVDDPTVHDLESLTVSMRACVDGIAGYRSLPKRVAAAISQGEEAFIQECAPRVLELCQSERSRVTEEGPSGRAEIRQNLGYVGPVGGYPLPFERLVVDMLHQEGARLLQQTGHAEGYEIPWYGQAHTFPRVAQLPELLKDREPRRVMEILCRDPKAKPDDVLKRSDDPLTDIARIQIENIFRMAKWFQRQLKETKQRSEHDALGPCELAVTRLMLSEYEKIYPSTRHLVKQFIRLASKRDISTNYQERFGQLALEVIRRSGKLKSMVADYDPEMAQRELLEVIAVRDYEKLTFIYSIGWDGVPKIAEEIDGVGRPTHSKLLDGRAMYGGGRLVLAKHEHAFHSLLDWLTFNRQYRPGKLPWVARQMDDGTGHYRIPPTSLKYSQAVIVPELESAGISTKFLRVEDVIAPGLQLSW